MKDPAFLFYSSDFITGTYTMTNEQVGKYIRLLCLQHQKGMLTEQDMLFICNSFDKEIYSKFENDGEFYFNIRLKEETEKRGIHKTKQRENINKRWNKDTKVIPNGYQTDTKVIPNGYQEQYQIDTKLIPLENENEINIIKNKGIVFENILQNIFSEIDIEFWNTFPEENKKERANIIASELQNSEQWHTYVAQSLKLTEKQTLVQLREFLKERMAADEMYKSLPDLKRYFINWCKKQKVA